MNAPAIAVEPQGTREYIKDAVRNAGADVVPVEQATGDYFGAERPGDNLFAETLLAVDLNTGERKWHYQLVHHGIWDMDIPCAPILFDAVVDGRAVKAVAQPTKQAFLYVFDRKTGQPVPPAGVTILEPPQASEQERVPLDAARQVGYRTEPA